MRGSVHSIGVEPARRFEFLLKDRGRGLNLNPLASSNPGRFSKSAIEVTTATDLVPILELIKQAVEAGELDAQIEAAANKLRDGFSK